MIHIKCPKCGDYLSVLAERVGYNETCPNCSNITVVPDVSSNSKTFSPEEKKKEQTFLFGIASNEIDPATTAWVFGTMAVCMVVGALVGAPMVDPEDPITGVFLGGFSGGILGVCIGMAIAYATKSRK